MARACRMDPIWGAERWEDAPSDLTRSSGVAGQHHNPMSHLVLSLQVLATAIRGCYAVLSAGSLRLRVLKRTLTLVRGTPGERAQAGPTVTCPGAQGHSHGDVGNLFLASHPAGIKMLGSAQGRWEHLGVSLCTALEIKFKKVMNKLLGLLWAVSVPVRPCYSLLGSVRFCWAQLGHVGVCWDMFGFVEPCQALSSSVKSYRAL